MIFNWFNSKKEVEEEDEWSKDIRERIHDIRRRIEEQKRAIGYYQARPKAIERHEEVVEQRKDMDPTPEEKRKAELDDLKSKLMRRK